MSHRRRSSSISFFSLTHPIDASYTAPHRSQSATYINHAFANGASSPTEASYTAAPHSLLMAGPSSQITIAVPAPAEAEPSRRRPQSTQPLLNATGPTAQMEKLTFKEKVAASFARGKHMGRGKQAASSRNLVISSPYCFRHVESGTSTPAQMDAFNALEMERAMATPLGEPSRRSSELEDVTVVRGGEDGDSMRTSEKVRMHVVKFGERVVKKVQAASGRVVSGRMEGISGTAVGATATTATGEYCSQGEPADQPRRLERERSQSSLSRFVGSVKELPKVVGGRRKKPGEGYEWSISEEERQTWDDFDEYRRGSGFGGKKVKLGA